MSARSRLVPAVGAAVAAAEAAALLLRPRDGLVSPVTLDATGYFSRAEIDRSRSFRRPQLALGLMNAGLELGGAIALHRALKRRAAPVGGAVGAAAAGAAMTVGASLLTLPLRSVARRRSLRVGLATDSWGAWASDSAKAAGIGAALSGAASAGGVLLVRRYGTGWWLPASGALVGASALMGLIAPVVLDPIFNEFSELEGEPREAVLGLAAEAGVEVRAVLSVDASRRTSAANAYVTGLGRTKRVVLFDTLLDRYPPAERDLVIAHELAHVRHRDVPRQIAFLAMTAPATAYAAARIGAALDPDGLGRGTADARSLPALGLALGAATALSGPATLRLSRRVENRADSDALRMRPGDVDAFVGFEKRIALQNLADPDPPKWLQRLVGTHPTTMERIGLAEAVRRQAA